MKKIFTKLIGITFFIFAIFNFIGCSKSKTDQKATKNIAIFVPGIASGSPIYDMLVKGAEKAVSETDAKSTLVEAGTNQAEWNSKLTALVASGNYDLIITSNPSLPDLIVPLTKDFPNVKFIILDAFCEGNPNIATVQYNQKEQAFLSGLAAGLVTTSTEANLKYANSQKKVALIAAQEYPVMNNLIFPSFEAGAQFVDPEITAEFRVVGSWADATKAFELANSLYNEGVDVILPIAGAGGQGVISAAKSNGFYIAWFDDDGYDKAPGLVVSSVTLEQEKVAYEMVKSYLNDQVEFGTAKTLGIKDGFVKFVFDNENFVNYVPTSIQNTIKEVYSKIQSGEYEFADN